VYAPAESDLAYYGGIGDGKLEYFFVYHSIPPDANCAVDDRQAALKIINNLTHNAIAVKLGCDLYASIRKAALVKMGLFRKN
jgi:hypothetical protein